MSNSQYSSKVIKHFQKPKNFGQIKDPDGIGEVGNPVCGDVMKLYVKVGQDKAGQDVLKDVKFETLGCVAAIATSSVVTELAKNKSVLEALKITKDDVIKALDYLPAPKIHCSLLAADALIEAIYNYYSKVGKSIPEELDKKHQQVEEIYHHHA